MARTVGTTTTLGELIEALMDDAHETYGDAETAAVATQSLLYALLEEPIALPARGHNPSGVAVLPSGYDARCAGT